MATSGSADWTQTRDQIIKRGCRKARLLSSGESPSSALLTDASDALNAIIKNLQVEGVQIWAVKWIAKTFTASSEVTGSDGNIYTCIRAHTSSTADEPVTGANWSTYWVKRGVTGGTWADVTPYTSIGDFALDTDLIAVDKAFIRKDGIDTQLAVKSFQDYAAISDKAQEGTPDVLYIDQQLTARAYLVPQPDDTALVLHYHKIRHIEDFDAATDTPDFPVRWIEILVKLLAADLGEDFNMPLSEINNLRSKANKLIIKAMASDAPKTDDNFIASAY